MKSLVLTILLCFAWLVAQSQTFEIRLRNAGSGVIAVEMRETSGHPPTTSDFLTDLVFGICWPTSYGVSLGSVTTSYTILKAGPEFTSGSTRVQLFAKDPNPITFPVDWVTNQWVVIMTIPNNLAGAGFGTFELCPTNIQELNININLDDYTPTDKGAATGVQIGPLIPEENIVAAEYFFDTDPGVGNGTPISITSDDTVTVQNLSIPQCLPPGTHRLYIRGRNALGEWGFYAQSEFTVDPVTISGVLDFCAGSSTTLTASGGTSYSWSTGANTAGITVTNGGTYTVTVTGQNGCTLTASATVTEKPAPNAGISGTLAICAGQTTTLTGTGGTSYAWSTGANTASIDVSTAGTYTVIATGANGCTGTASATVTVNALPTAGISGTLVICAGQTTTLTGTGGTSYAWSTGANTASIDVSTAGTYTVTATNAAGCTGTASATVTVNPLPTAGISGVRNFCPGLSTTLTGTGGTSYSWSTGANTASITISTAAIYTVTVSDTNGCTNTTNANVTENPSASALIIGNLTICAGQTTMLTGSGGGTYAWSTGEDTQIITTGTAGPYTVTVTNLAGCTATASATVVVNPLPTAGISGTLAICAGQTTTLTGTGGASYAWSTGANTASINVSTAGTYTVTATNAAGCTGTASATVAVNPLPTAGVSGTLNFCPGFSTTLTGTGGTSYAWSTGANTASISVNAAGTYTVTATNVNGCSNTASASVTQNPGVSASISGTLAICAGQSTTLTGNGGTSYAWSTGANTAAINVNTAGTYTVTATNASGCTGTASATVVVNPLPAASISGTLTICAGQSTTLTSSAGTSYAWSTGANSASISTSTAGTYTVTVTNAAGCTATATATVTVNQLPTAGISGVPEICPGGSTTLTGTGGASYAWSTGANTVSINVNAADTYTVTATDANGCTGTASVTVVENENVTVTIDGDLSICAGQTTTLTATAGASYLWSTGATTQSITTGTAGTYTVTVASAAGCTGSNSATVVVNPLPTASISGTLAICAGQTTTLTGNGGSSYAWSTGANTSQIVIGAGTYTVTTTDANGCTNTASATVVANPLPTAGISGTLNFCPGLSTTLTGTGGTSYAWSTGASTASINVNAAGSYTVTATNANGCTNTASASVTQNPGVSASISGTLTICAGQSTTLTGNGGTSYAWSTGANTAAINVNTAGAYTVTATNASGCTGTASATVVVNPLPAAGISGTLTICTGQTTTLTGTGGTSYAWSTGANTASISVGAGTYTVTATNNNGCTNTASATVVANPLPTAGISGTLNFCPGLSTTLTGTGGTSYAWSTGANTASISVNAAGTYTVTATNANGCSNTASASVTQNPGVSASISGTLTICAGQSTTLTGNGGTSYAWSTGANTASISVNAAGTYTVTATNASGCTGTATATVVVNPLPNASISGTLAICAGQSTTLTGNGGMSYAWSTGANTASINVNTSGTYTVTATSAAGCTATASATVVVNPLPNASISGLLEVCTGETTTLTASGGVSYAWSTGANTAAIAVGMAGTYTVTVTNSNGCTSTASAQVTESTNIVVTIGGVLDICANESTTLTATAGTSYSWSSGQNTQSITTSTAGTYTVTVTNAAGCTGTASVTLVVRALPNAAINGNLAFCTGTSTTLTASGGVSYAWSTGANTAAINVNTPGTYTVTVTGANGCTKTTSASVIQNPLPTASISGELEICSTETTTLTGSGGTSYAWSTGANTAAINVNTPGTYTVTVTDANGCTATTSATVAVKPGVTASISGNLVICADKTTTLTASGGSSYEWNTGATIQAIVANIAGDYIVTATNAVGCTGTASVTLVVNPLPTASISGPGLVCAGTTVQLTASGAPNFAWSTGAQTAAIHVNAAGTYTVTVTDGNGCTDTESKSVAQPPAILLGATPTHILCNGLSTGAIDLSASGGAPGGLVFEWSNGTGTEDLNGIVAGTYTVTVTDSEGCSATTSATVTEPSALVLSTVVTNVDCNAGNTGAIDLSVSGGTGAKTYAWSNGPSTQDLQNLAVGTYTVTVTDANSCTATTSATLVVDLNDPRPLKIICPPAGSLPTLTANSSCQAFLGDYRALVTITGGCSGVLDMVEQLPAPGATVNPGTVGVKLSISNSTGEVSSCIVNVNITGGCN